MERRSHNGEGFEGREYRISHLYRRSFGDISAQVSDVLRIQLLDDETPY